MSKKNPSCNTSRENNQNVYSILREEVRLSITAFLYQYQRLSFQDIVKLTGKAKSTVSHHLKILQEHSIINEVPIPNELKKHGKMKYYALAMANIYSQEILPDFQQIQPAQQEDMILELFDFGRMNLIFIRNIINQILEQMDETEENFNSSTENSSEFARSLKKEKLKQMFTLIQRTKIMAFPLTTVNYGGIMNGIVSFVRKFQLYKKKKPILEEKPDINWAIAFGFPLSKLNEIANLGENSVITDKQHRTKEVNEEKLD